MNKKLLELLNQINDKKAEVETLANERKLEEARAAKEELKAMQEQFELLKDVVDPNGDGTIPVPGNTIPVPADGAKDSTKAFADAARNRFHNSMSEGTAADGGYTVPEDIQTRINTYREAKASLLNLVTVEKVTTNKGQRTYKKRAQQTGFAKVGEGGKITGKDTPQFERLDYEIEKYAGYFYATNELFADSDANITNTLISWIGDESRVTANKLILEQINTIATTALADLDDIKKALNVTLGQAFKPISRIVTNDDGLQWLDTLKDSDGDYLLKPNPAEPMQMQLCAGATIVPVSVIPNVDLPSDNVYTKTSDGTITPGKTYYTESGGVYTPVAEPQSGQLSTYYEVTGQSIPMIIGDLKEAIVYWDRQQTSIMTSNIASIGTINAFEEDLTIFRAIEREDVTTRDTAAVVNGRITVGE